MPTVTLQYNDSGTDYTRDYDAISLRGFDDPDEFRIVMVQHEHLDGSITEDIQGFVRIATVDFGVLQDREDKQFLSRFLLSDERVITYDTTNISVVLSEPQRFVNEWMGEVRDGQRYVLRLEAKTIETIFGSGYGFDYGEPGYGEHL